MPIAGIAGLSRDSHSLSCVFNVAIGENSLTYKPAAKSV